MVPRTSNSFITTLCTLMVAGLLQIDTITTLPVGFMAATKVSNTLFTLVHSNATSTPLPSVSFITSATTSTSLGSRM